MSRYADLWSKMPNWVEAITTDKSGWVRAWSVCPHPAPHGSYMENNWLGEGGVQAYVLGNRGPTPDWRDSLERRPRPANPTLCPHCGKEI
jgi:hypothetical protein